MGQYYNILLKENKNNARWQLYDRSVDGEYQMAKLMEHSWWLNPTMLCICAKLYKSPHQVCWVGDYSVDGHPVNDLSEDNMKMLYTKAWRAQSQGGLKPRTLLSAEQLPLDGRYLVNWTKAEYIDGSVYFQRAKDKFGWVTHPLSILTAIGNGLGGGDYRGIFEECVGEWAGDMISIENAPPAYFTENDIVFIEN